MENSGNNEGVSRVEGATLEGIGVAQIEEGRIGGTCTLDGITFTDR